MVGTRVFYTLLHHSSHGSPFVRMASLLAWCLCIVLYCSQCLSAANVAGSDAVARDHRCFDCHGFSLVFRWGGEFQNITYSADAKFVSIVYRVILYGTDVEVRVITKQSMMSNKMKTIRKSSSCLCFL